MTGQSRKRVPLARCNPRVRAASFPRDEPIPARAGQLFAVSIRTDASRVYPRSRGATRSRWRPSKASMGLSPLARGNQLHQLCQRVVDGSIPARAGQPAAAAPGDKGGGVYPRSRGATQPRAPSRHASGGLSPLARGNLHRELSDKQWCGSIPARAGQPDWPTMTKRSIGVYPRSRGATPAGTRWKFPPPGLSPLARGNLLLGEELSVSRGSIPARAGQPRSAA